MKRLKATGFYWIMRVDIGDWNYNTSRAGGCVNILQNGSAIPHNA
jgi:hypothetical protein